MILIKLLVTFLIISTTSALYDNGKDENIHKCIRDRRLLKGDDIFIIDRMEDCLYPRCLVEQDNCECNEGYKIENNKCTPICQHKCVNGFCRKPGLCGCDIGYDLDSTNTTCLPNLYTKCPEFFTGYKPNNLTKKCEPICPDMPKNAQCMEPSIWECNPNFRHDLRSNKCILKTCKCHDNKGYCLDFENQCECYEGFKKNSSTGQCVSVCEPQCMNANCVANNVCQCLDGYHATSKAHICEMDIVPKWSCGNYEHQRKFGFIRFEDWCVPVSIFVTIIVGISLLLMVLVLCILRIYYLIARTKIQNKF